MAWMGEERDRRFCYTPDKAFVHGPHNYYELIDQKDGNVFATWFFCIGCDYAPKHRKST